MHTSVCCVADNGFLNMRPLGDAQNPRINSKTQIDFQKNFSEQSMVLIFPKDARIDSADFAPSMCASLLRATVRAGLRATFSYCATLAASWLLYPLL